MFSLDLSGNKLEGTLPALPSQMLEMLVADNKITGTIPSSYYNSASPLVALEISTNRVCLFPHDILLYTVHHCHIYGSLRTSRCGNSCTDMGAVSCCRSLETFPSQFAAMANLTFFSVAFNNITGQLPSDWSALKALQVFDVEDNQLTGMNQRHKQWEHTAVLQRSCSW